MTMSNIKATLAIAMMQVGRFRNTSAFSSSPKQNRTFASIENLGGRESPRNRAWVQAQDWDIRGKVVSSIMILIY